MATQLITINQTFNAPVAEVFATLCDHEQFGKICGINMKRVIDGKDNKNGLGSVREIKIGLLPVFQETVTNYVNNERMEYKITKGSPIKNHQGIMIFSDKAGKTELLYTIQLESKIPLTTFLIKSALGFGIGNGLKRYAASLNEK